MKLQTLIPCLILITQCTLLGEEARQWGRIMEERFETDPKTRYQLLLLPRPGATSSGGRMFYDKDHHTQALSGRFAMVGNVVAGAHVELKMKLLFTPPAKDEDDELATAVVLSFVDSSVAGMEIRRAKTPEGITRIQFVQERPGKPAKTVLREFEIPGLAPDGLWLLRCQFGHLTVEVNDKIIGSAYCDGLYQPMQGFMWVQKGGEAVCSEILLDGELLAPLPAEDIATLAKAKRLNETAKALLRDHQADEALEKMREALALFVSVHGEDHPDSANAHANLATILAERRDFAEAIVCWNKAITINEVVLGATHPNTTTARFNLGRLEFEHGSKTVAKDLWKSCRAEWLASMGPDYPLVKQLDKILQSAF